MASTAVREKPKNFRDHDVRAILDGRKSQFREIVKPQPLGEHDKCFGWLGESVPPTADCAAKGLYCESDRGLFLVSDSPYEVGMRLWVRETWRPILSGINEGKFDYRADDPSASGEGFIPWRSPIHMPRRASRLTLEITGVRVEKLNQIAWPDAIAEGMRDPRRAATRTNDKHPNSPVAQFRNLWESLHGKGSWEASPWVWVVSFRRVEA